MSDGTSASARIIAALERAATDGVVTMSRPELSRLSGISERQLQVWMVRMHNDGVLEPIGGGKWSAATYRLLRPELIDRGTTKSWSDERDALVREKYPTVRSRYLLPMLNALPGPPLTSSRLKDHAKRMGLRYAGGSDWNKGRGSKPKSEPAPKAERFAWKTPEGAARFRRMYESGAPMPEIAAAFGMGLSTADYFRRQLGMATRRNMTHVAVQPRAAAPQERTMFERPMHVSGMRFQSSVTCRTPAINWAALPSVPRPNGRCCWPLTCDAPSTGKYCAEHGALTRRAGREAVA